jgi:flavin reductase (DIM6/NTAB) family NADH-FMN oxidoreductase RutF
VSDGLDDLEPLLDRLDTTGCIVTTAWEGRVAGCFVSYVTECNLDPPRLCVFTSHENLTHELVEASGVLAVHLLAAGDEGWVVPWGRRSGRDVDKLAGVRWRPGVTGAPILDGPLGWIEGRVIASLDCGDHTARVVEPVAAELRDERVAPLSVLQVFRAGAVPGRAPSRLPG